MLPMSYEDVETLQQAIWNGDSPRKNAYKIYIATSNLC